MNDTPLVLIEERPTRADALKNRDLLLRTAAQLFAEHGVDEVNMSMIAQKAGVGKGTLYRHFTNKTELCHALLDQDQRNLQDRTLLRLRQNHPPLEDLSWYLDQVIAFVIRNLFMLRVVGDGAPATLENAAHIWWRQTIRGLLGRANVSGDLDYLADTLYVLLDPQTICYQMHTCHYDQERILAGLHEVMDRLVA
jgi:AcrR family transcriptional regulator